MRSWLKFAVIITRSHGKWVFCKHRESGENIFDTAERELKEETFSMLFVAEIDSYKCLTEPIKRGLT